MRQEQVVERMLENSADALSSTDISKRMGINSRDASKLLVKLGKKRKDLNRFVRHGRFLYYIGAERQDLKVKPLIPDLWRGWINPATGYAPEKLGI